MRILVTGHRGNVGVPVARHPADLGWRPRYRWSGRGPGRGPRA
jgi:hypothetical protein